MTYNAPGNHASFLHKINRGELMEVCSLCVYECLLDDEIGMNGLILICLYIFILGASHKYKDIVNLSKFELTGCDRAQPKSKMLAQAKD